MAHSSLLPSVMRRLKRFQLLPDQNHASISVAPHNTESDQDVSSRIIDGTQSVGRIDQSRGGRLVGKAIGPDAVAAAALLLTNLRFDGRRSEREQKLESRMFESDRIERGVIKEDEKS